MAPKVALLSVKRMMLQRFLLFFFFFKFATFLQFAVSEEDSLRWDAVGFSAQNKAGSNIKPAWVLEGAQICHSSLLSPPPPPIHLLTSHLCKLMTEMSPEEQINRFCVVSGVRSCCKINHPKSSFKCKMFYAVLTEDILNSKSRILYVGATQAPHLHVWLLQLPGARCWNRLQQLR